MIQIHRAEQRGQANYGWLDAQYSFSFADYYNPERMGWSVLRVINEDRVSPAAGFDTHPHRDMEIISYILSGTIEHRDTMGEHTQLKAGEVQVMSAGRGIQHSEYNPSSTETLHLLQIWIRPDTQGVEPRYQQQDFSLTRGKTLLVGPKDSEAPLWIHQNARLYQLKLNDEIQELSLDHHKHYYLQLISGHLSLDEQKLHPGDGAAVQASGRLELIAEGAIEALWFELP